MTNVYSVPNGIPDLQVVNRTTSLDGRVRLGVIGADRVKGYNLIKYALLLHQFFKLRLAVVDLAMSGDSRAEVWNGTPVEFISRLPADKVTEFYARIDVLLAPSTCIESFGLVTREALHCGCWVVASDRGSIGECVIEDRNGHIVNVSSANDLVRVLSIIEENSERYRQPPPPSAQLRKATDQADELAAIYKSIIESTDNARLKMQYGAPLRKREDSDDLVTADHSL